MAKSARRREPRERLRDWVDEVGGAKAAAQAVGCHRTYLVHLLEEDTERRPGLDVAFAIERATSGSKTGVIEAKEWSEPIKSTGTDG